jgi:hypothetical protein
MRKKKVKLQHALLQQKVKSLKHGVKQAKYGSNEPSNSKRDVVEH